MINKRFMSKVSVFIFGSLVARGTGRSGGMSHHQQQAKGSKLQCNRKNHSKTTDTRCPDSPPLLSTSPQSSPTRNNRRPNQRPNPLRLNNLPLQLPLLSACQSLLPEIFSAVNARDDTSDNRYDLLFRLNSLKS